MREEEIHLLISHGETLDVEFKGEEKQSLNDTDLVEAVVCLANRSGNQPGYLLVGVEDDGRITGARPRHPGGKTDPLQVQALIANRTRPSLTCQVKEIPIDGLPVLAIRVSPSRLPIGTTDGKYIRRAMGGKGKPECRPFHFHEMQALQADRGILDYSALPVTNATWDDLDPLEFERFRRFIRESKGQGDFTLLNLPDLELAKALGAIEANHQVSAIRILGLLLFGKEQALQHYLASHEVAFQVISSEQIEVNDFFRWPLLRVMDELLGRFRARNREEEIMVGFLRIGVPDYPERAFREAVANAMVHRDYTRLGAVHIQWQDDHIEISNPGGFPEGVTLDNLLVTPPRPRNPLLADAFKRAGIVERTARGIDTIFYEQLRNGRPAPSYERSGPTDVVLVLPGGKANLAFARLVAEESQADRLLSLDDLLILNALWMQRRISSTEAARLIQKPETESRASLSNLVEQGLAEARGERKGRSYHLSAATYRRLGEEAAYVRQHGFEPIQQEQMVLQYVKKHGSIARREVASLCHLGTNQAYRLLKRLERQGILRRSGKKGRSTRYVESSN